MACTRAERLGLWSWTGDAGPRNRRALRRPGSWRGRLSLPRRCGMPEASIPRLGPLRRGTRHGVRWLRDAGGTGSRGAGTGG